MKLIFILLILVFGIFSCADDNCDGYYDDSRKECSNDNDCLKALGENYICSKAEIKNEEDNSLHKESLCDLKYCIKDDCKTNNVDCGRGRCINSYIHGVSCLCDDGDLNYLNRENNRTTCIENKCDNSFVCMDSYYIKNNKVYYTKACSPEGICVETCSNDNDCMGKYEKCSFQDDNLIGCLDLYNPDCGEGYYNDFYGASKIKEGDIIDENATSIYYENKNRYCGKLCVNNDSCNMGFICSEDKRCLPLCFSDEDCLRDKFSNGNKCDSELNYCVNE